MLFRVTSHAADKFPLELEARNEEAVRKAAMRKWYGAVSGKIPSADGSNFYTGRGLMVDRIKKGKA